MSLSELLRIIIPVDIRESGNPDPIISIDASQVIRHNRRATPTRNPVEQGSDVTDHVILDPIALEVEGMITDSPIQFFSPVFTGVGSIADFDESVSRSKQNFDLIELLWQDRIPFDVNTRLRFYENMVITGFDTPQDAQTGQAIDFSLRMEQIRIVDTAQAGTIPGADSGLPAGAANAARLGTLTTLATAAAIGLASAALFGNP